MEELMQSVEQPTEIIIQTEQKEISFNPQLVGKMVKCTGRIEGLYRVVKLEGLYRVVKFVDWDTLQLMNSKGLYTVLIDDLVFGAEIEMSVIH